MSVDELDRENIYWIGKRGNLNWSGKEFSKLPAKVYMCYMDLVEAINNYGGCVPNRTFTCQAFNTIQKRKLLEKKKIRF